MSVVVDQQSWGMLVDAVAAGTTSSGAMLSEDGARPPPWQDEPWAGRQEYLASESMKLAAIPASEIMKIRPVVPQQIFPDNGIGYDQTPLTIDQVFDAGLWNPQPRSWISGATRQVRHSDTDQQMWEGTARNSSNSVNPAG
jgi:hypothetical protein